VDAKIRRGIEELNRGEGIPEDVLDAHLERLKAQRDGWEATGQPTETRP